MMGFARPGRAVAAKIQSGRIGVGVFMSILVLQAGRTSRFLAKPSNCYRNRLVGEGKTLTWGRFVTVGSVGSFVSEGGSILIGEGGRRSCWILSFELRFSKFQTILKVR